jgi:hypothetical protein
MLAMCWQGFLMNNRIKTLPRNSLDLPPSIWGLGEFRRDPGASVGRSLCAPRPYAHINKETKKKQGSRPNENLKNC